MTIFNLPGLLGLPGIDITVRNGDLLNVAFGGVASSTVVSNGGTVNVSSGGSANFSVLSNGGTANVFSGGIADFTILSAGGTATVFSGGTADFTVVSNGGSITVSGGTASGTVLSGGWEYVTGGTANTVLSSGHEFVESGGHADFDVVSGAGELFVFNGGLASGAVLSGGYEFVSAGGEVLDTVDDNGFVQVEGGLAIGTVLNSGAEEDVFSGGVASGTTVNRFTFELVYGKVSGVVVSGGSQIVSSGGVASGTVLRGIGARESVSAGGSAVGTVISSGGQEVVVAGGNASGTIVSFGGQEVVAVSGASFSVISSGGMIDLLSIPYNSGGSAVLNPQDDVLTVTEGNDSYQQKLSGNYAANSFQASRDSGDATLITMTAGGSTSAPELASASIVTPNPVDFGDVHVGEALSQALSVTNTAPTSGSPEALDGEIGSATGAATINNGSFEGLAASHTDSISLVVGLSTSTEGVQNGTALISLESDGTAIDSNGTTDLPSQTIVVIGTVYGFAQPNVTQSLNFGAARVGEPALERPLLIGDGTTADAFQEGLIYSIGTPPSAFSVPSGETGTIASGSGTAATLALSTAKSGDFNGSTITVGLTSTGTAASVLPDTVLTAQPVTLSGKVYAPAVARLGSASLNFGVVHVGDTVSATVAVSNVASGALTDVLTGGFDTVTGRFSGLGNLGAGVAAGAGGTLTIDMATTAAGVASGSASLSLASHDNDLPDESVTAGSITLVGTVDNYAAASWEELSGGGFHQSGSVYTLNFGTVTLGATAPVADLGALNAATGLADQMSGTFQTSGSGFINNGLATFSGLSAGQADTAPSVSLSTAQVGTFTEAITLLASGSNSSGFSGTLTPQVLMVTGTVVPSSRTLVWNGTGGSSFANPLNWEDLTDGLAQAQTPPSGNDTIEFNNVGGGISGTGTVSTVVVGASGAGALQLTGGATIVASSLEASTDPAAVSQINLTDAGAELIINGPATVAGAGTGILSVFSGATVTANSLSVGSQEGSSGELDLSGAGTDFSVTGSATVADDGTAVMSVLNGATFAAANLTIGNQGDSSGAVVVSGDNTIVNVSGDLNVGTALGTGDLTIGPGATVNALVVNLQGQVVLENGELDPTVNLINQGQTAGGSGTIAAGDIVDEGVIQAGGSKPSQKLLVVAGTVLGGGPWTINGTAQPQANGAVGILQVNAGGTLELTGPVLNAASTTFTDDVTPQSTYTVNDSVVDVNFEDATGVLKLDDIGGFAGTIVAFRKGDSFVITGGTLSNAGVTDGTTLTVSDSGNGGTDSLIFGSGISASGFSIVNGNTIQVACFAAGTRISTGSGLIAVEELSVGDRAVTDDGTCEPIVWIGQRTVHCKRHPKPETVSPVRVMRGAFGRNVPLRDLYLSPDHAVFVNGVLVPVKLLINGTSIARVRRDRVTYYHVELPRHAVILAEGLTVESYLDLGDRADFANGGETIRLFPDFASRLAPDTAWVWETRGAAPLVMTGLELEAAQRAVMKNAPRHRSRSMRLNSRVA
jgi:T5SS/PEP-CTERM-associated repeat protein/autotransporter passenger strand-loop-strand repeat protein